MVGGHLSDVTGVLVSRLGRRCEQGGRPCEDQEEGALCKPRREASKHINTWTLECESPEL